MNTKFEMNVATLVRPDGITAVHDSYPTSGERDEILMQNVHIGRITRGKINRSIIERGGCETAREAMEVVQYFAAGDERAIRKIERAAEIPE